MHEIPQEKVCKKCGPPAQPLDAFSINNALKSGRSNICRSCTKKKQQSYAYYANNKERLAPKYAQHRAENREGNRIYATNYYTQNKDGKIATYLKTTRSERLAKRAQWRAENPDDGKNYYAEHKDQSKEKHAQYYLENAEEILARNAAWRKANPEAAATLNRRRRARKKNAPVNDLSAEQWKEIQVAFNYRCVYCPMDCKECKKKAHKLTQDHVTPYTHNGSNTLWNVVPACLSCNSRKNNGPPPRPVQPLLLSIAPSYKPKRKKKGA